MLQVYFVKLCSNHFTVVVQMHSLFRTLNQHSIIPFILSVKS